MISVEDKAKIVFDQLELEYPEVRTFLEHSNVFELLIATMLSPQTPDETTNKVTPKLFSKYASPEALAMANLDDVLNLIRPINFNRTKSERIIQASKLIVDNHENKVPHLMEYLLEFPGVGRKVANLVISEWYATEGASTGEYETVNRGSIDQVGFIVDTHVLRVSYRMGLTKNTKADKIELDLMKLFPSNEWNNMSLRFISHGREWNQARSPKFMKHPFWSNYYSKHGNTANII